MMLFNTIVSDTRAVAIGPLEYCGNGRVIKLPHGKTLYDSLPAFCFSLSSNLSIRVSIVRHDPSVPQFYAQWKMIGLTRKADGLGRNGDLKKSMSQAQKRKRRQIVEKSGLLSGSSSLPPTDLDEQPLKRRHLSADKALVVSQVGIDINVESILLGRRK